MKNKKLYVYNLIFLIFSSGCTLSFKGKIVELAKLSEPTVLFSDLTTYEINGSGTLVLAVSFSGAKSVNVSKSLISTGTANCNVTEAGTTVFGSSFILSGCTGVGTVQLRLDEGSVSGINGEVSKVILSPIIKVAEWSASAAIKIIGSNQLFFDTCSYFDIAFKDSSNNYTSASEAYILNLSGGQGLFYESDCSTNLTSVVLSTGDNIKRVYYKVLTGASASQNITITKAGGGLASDTMSVNLTPPSASQSVDSTFGTTGFLWYTSGITDWDYGRNLIPTPDGGSVGINHHNPARVIKLNSSGALDTSFNSSGVYIPSGFTSTSFFGLSIQHDQKILVSGTFSQSGVNYAGVMRLNSNGSLDTAFGNAGFVLVQIGDASTTPRFSHVEQLKNSKIILGGNYRSSGTDGFFVYQLKADGSTDTSFGDSGRFFQKVSTGHSSIAHINIDSSGNIFAVGSGTNGVKNSAYVLKLLPSGLADSSFGTAGISQVDFDVNENYGKKILVNRSGKINVLISYNTGDAIPWSPAIVQLQVNGSIDTTYATSGKLLINSVDETDRAFVANDLELQPDDSLLIASGHLDGTNRYYAITKINSSGALVAGFGTAGSLLIDSGNTSEMDVIFSLKTGYDGRVSTLGLRTTWIGGVSTGWDWGWMRFWK